MNPKIRIAAGVAAGLVAGATLIGAAFAAPRMMSNATAYGSGYGMMRYYDGAAGGAAASIADMNSFMDAYRDADGSIDVDRMHADVAAGTVTMPYLGGPSSANRGSRGQSGSDARQRGPRMMRGTAAADTARGSYLNMMDSRY